MIGAPNAQTLNYMVRVLKGAPSTSVIEEIADIFRNLYIRSRAVPVQLLT